MHNLSADSVHPSLCETFRSRATWTWDLLSRARRVGTQIGEETITDLNILELRTRHPTQIYNKTFNKQEEGKNGADWEWWMTGESAKWIGFRVQAKVLDLESNEFSHLHYRKDSSSPFQCEVLIRKALTGTRRRIPLYCLYMHRKGGMVSPQRCPSFSLNPEGFGCSLLTAFAVRYLRSLSRSKSKRLPQIIPHVNPWHCLVCCRGYDDSDLPHRAIAYWKNVLQVNENRLFTELPDGEQAEVESELVEEQNIYREMSVSAEPPSYVQRILEGDQVDRPDPELRSVTIIEEQE